MNKVEVIDIIRNKLFFSDLSIKKIEKYVHLLLTFNKSYNLISRTTEKDVWLRHILDSAQLVSFIDNKVKGSVSDLGSGAGLPGLIIAMFNDNNDFHVKLYEKSSVKRNFLSKTIKELELNAEILNNVYEDKIYSKYVVCRAFKKLNKILDISREIVEKPHKLIILKGKNAQAEINAVSLTADYSYKLEKSITDNDSKIIIINAK